MPSTVEIIIKIAKGSSILGVSHKLYVSSDMTSKSLDGLTTGEFDEVFVSDNVVIKGNLTVNGTITGGGGATTDNYYVATDASNQFRANSNTVELVSTTSTTPTFRLKNNAGVTTTSTLEVGQANVVNLGSTGISNSGTINTGTLTTGVLNSTSGTVGATTVTTSGQTTVANLVTTLDTQSTNASTGAIVTPGGLGVAKAAHVGGQLHCTSSAASTSTTTGALRVNGGVGIAGSVYAGGDVHVTGTTTTNNLVSNLNVDGASGITVSNPNTGTNAYPIITFDTDNVNSGVIFMNGSNRTFDGGANTMTIRNDAGNLLLQNNTGSGLTVTSGSVSTPATVTAGALTTSGNVTSAGAIVGGNGLIVNGQTQFDQDIVLSTNGQIRRNTSDGSDTGSLVITGGGGDSAASRGGKIFLFGNESILPGLVGLSAGNVTGGQINFYTGNQLLRAQFTESGQFSCGPVVSTSSISSSTLASSGNTSVGGNLTVTGATTLNDIFVQNDQLDADDSSPGSVFTWGGFKAVKKVYAGGGIVIPYGQAIQANTAFGTNAKMMQMNYDVGQDKLCLYSSGNSPGSGPNPVLKVNSLQCELPQTTVSTSTTTGALQVAGGVGIGGNLHVGGTITGGSVSYGSTSSGTFDVTNGTGTTLTVDSTDDASSTTTGCATFAGGLGVAKNLHVGGTLTAGTVTYSTTSTGTMDITNSPGTTLTVDSTEEATSTTTGATTISGGLGVGKSCFIGGSQLIGATPTNAVRTLTLQNTDVSSGSAVSLVFDTNNVNSGELLMNGPNHPFNPNDMVLRNLAGNLLLYGVANSGFYVGNGYNFSQQIFITQNTNQAVAYNNASMITAGGLGVEKSTMIGENLTAGTIPTDGGRGIVSTNQSTGTDAFAFLTLDTSAVGNSTIFMNGPNRTGDGGANTLTMRNDAGDVRIQNGSGTTVTLAGPQLNISSKVVADNEIAVQRSGAAEFRTYNNGSVTEWVFGQRSISDHDFTISSLNSGSYTDKLRLNTSGQIKLGSGPFFGHESGTWTPKLFFAGGGEVNYNDRSGYWVRTGNMVTIACRVEFNYGSGYSGAASIRNIPFIPQSSTFAGMMPLMTTELAGLSKPYMAGYEVDGVTNPYRIYFSNGSTYYTAQVFGVGGQKVNFQVSFIIGSTNPDPA
jgi:hypothetical protein